MQSKVNSSNKISKMVSMVILTVLSAGICISGIFFIFYSWIRDITFKVLNTNVPGVIFGLVVAYLGFRYLLSVSKLKKELYKETSVFSWKNFRKQKTAR